MWSEKRRARKKLDAEHGHRAGVWCQICFPRFVPTPPPKLPAPVDKRLFMIRGDLFDDVVPLHEARAGVIDAMFHSTLDDALREYVKSYINTYCSAFTYTVKR